MTDDSTAAGNPVTEITWQGRRMLLEDKGMVDYVGTNGKPLRFMIGTLKPLPAGPDAHFQPKE